MIPVLTWKRRCVMSTLGLHDHSYLHKHPHHRHGNTDTDRQAGKRASRTHTELGVPVHAYNPRVGEEMTKGFLGLAD